MNNIWFTSDQHFSHENIRRLCNRPFDNVEEMNEALIENYNKAVKKSDTVYMLGDFGFNRETLEIFNRLNGSIVYIFGNHDKKFKNKIVEYKNVLYGCDIANIKIGEQKITLCHYPMTSFNCSHYGAWQLYGHHHGDVSEYVTGKKMNVCVDVNEYLPVSYDEVIGYMSARDDNWDMIRR